MNKQFKNTASKDIVHQFLQTDIPLVQKRFAETEKLLMEVLTDMFTIFPIYAYSSLIILLQRFVEVHGFCVEQQVRQNALAPRSVAAVAAKKSPSAQVVIGI